MDRLAALRVFVRVADLGSFSRAAEYLALPRATVSAAVAQVEGEFSARLLQRTTRKVSLTADGAAMLERARGLIDEFESLYGQLRPSSANVSGRLIVDLPSRIARRIVVPALPQLLDQHPALEIDLRSDDRRIDLIEEGVDCAVRVGTLAPNSLVARPLGRLRMINCASPAYLAARPRLRTLGDLKRHVAIHYSAERDGGGRSATAWDVGADDPPRQASVPCRLTVHTAETYIACGIAGLGLIQVPAFDVRGAMARGDLVEVLPRWRPAAMPVNALYPHRRHLSPRVRMFLDWMQQLLAETL